MPRGISSLRQYHPTALVDVRLTLVLRGPQQGYDRRIRTCPPELMTAGSARTPVVDVDVEADADADTALTHDLVVIVPVSGSGLWPEPVIEPRPVLVEPKCERFVAPFRRLVSSSSRSRRRDCFRRSSCKEMTGGNIGAAVIAVVDGDSGC